MKEHFEKRFDDLPKATQVKVAIRPFRSVAALNQKFIEVEVAVDSLRGELDAERNRAENVRSDHGAKFRSIREELKSLKVKPKKKADISVIVSQDVNPPDQDEKDDDDEIKPVGPLLEPTKKINDLATRLMKLEKETAKQPVSMGQTEFMRDEMLSEENQRLWRSMTKFEEQLKAIVAESDSSGGKKKVANHPTAPGALAAAINQLQTQITSGLPNETWTRAEED